MTDATAELVAALERARRYVAATVVRMPHPDATADLDQIDAALARAKAEDVQAASERSLWRAHDQRLAALQEPGHG